MRQRLDDVDRIVHPNGAVGGRRVEATQRGGPPQGCQPPAPGHALSGGGGGDSRGARRAKKRWMQRMRALSGDPLSHPFDFIS